MAGGLIEGFQKLFKGKNVAQKHLFLFGLATAAFLFEMIGKEQNITLAFFTGLGAFVVQILVGLYYLHFTHNAVKFCIYRDREENIQKVKAIQIMPELNLNLFAHFWSWIGFGLLWFLIMLAVVIVIGLFMIIPIVSLFAYLALIVLSVCIAFTYPIILAGFAESYQIKGNVSLVLLFSYLPKVFIPMLLLSLKVALIMLPFAGIIFLFFTMGLFTSMNELLLYVLGAIFTYICYLLSFSCAYEVANIYYDKIKLNEEI